MKPVPIRVISTKESDVLEIRFFPSDLCNFNCSYCFAGSHDGVYRYPKDVETVTSNFKKLIKFYKDNFNKNKFRIMIAGGGEPTLWPDLELFCKSLKETYDVYITVVTNGSRSLRWWKENASFFDDIVLSCHNEFVDIDHYIAVGDTMFEAGAKVTGLMVMDALNWPRCVSYIEKMMKSKYPWFIEAKPVVDAPGRGVDVYTAEQLNYIGMKRIPNSEWLFNRLDDYKIYESVILFDNNTAKVMKPGEIITNKFNYFKGWDCNLGIESISISSSGNISGSCGINPFNKELNIFSDTFDINFTINTVSCPYEKCVCQPDTHISKLKTINFV